MRPALSAVAALLCLSGSGWSAVDHLLDGTWTTPVAELSDLRANIREGDWNARIHAAHRLGAMGPAAVPVLRESLRDADWQVRFTAVHMLGRLGSEAAPALQEALETDPCQVVRISAVHWLGEMGALDALRDAGGDESGMVRMTRWYWLRKQGALEPDSAQPGGPLSEDLNVCLDSPFVLSTEARRQLESARAGGSEAPLVLAHAPGPVEEVVKEVRRFDSNVVVVIDGSGAPETDPAAPAPAPELEPLDEDEDDLEPTGASRPAGPALPAPSAKKPPKAAVTDVDRFLELDTVIREAGPRGKPEDLPRPTGVPRRSSAEHPVVAMIPGRRPSEPGLRVEEPPPAPPEEERLLRPAGVPRRSPPEHPVVARILGRRASEPGLRVEEPPSAPLEKERLPRPEGPGPRAEAPATAEPGLMDDHGAGTPEHDPIPALLEALGRGSLPLRCRAAEELGKRGPAAKEAVPALMEALRGKSPRLRASAAVGLGGIGAAAEPAVKNLSRALRDASADVRYSAAHALARIGTPAAKRAFKRYLRSEARKSILESGARTGR